MKNNISQAKWGSNAYDVEDQQNHNTEPITQMTEYNAQNLYSSQNDQHFGDSRAFGGQQLDLYRLDTDQIAMIFQTFANEAQHSQDSDSIKYHRTVPPAQGSARSHLSQPCLKRQSFEFNIPNIKTIRKDQAENTIRGCIQGAIIRLQKLTLQIFQNSENIRPFLSKYALILDQHSSSDLFVQPVLYYNSQQIWCYMQQATCALKLYQDGKIPIKKYLREVDNKNLPLENVYLCHRTGKFCKFLIKDVQNTDINSVLNRMKRQPQCNIEIDNRGDYEEYTAIMDTFLHGYISIDIRPKQLYFVGSGTYGRIYVDQNQSTVIKRVSFAPSISSYNCKMETINEVCLLHLCKQLISPEPQSLNIIETPNYLQFRMQRCIPLKMLQKTPQQLQQLFDQFRSNLDKMHQMKIFHRDIKPQNILFNKRLNRLVLIDFGMARFTDQVYNRQHFSIYCGTKMYLSENMKQLQSDLQGYIDLRQNDRYAAQQAIKQIRQMKLNQVDNQDHLEFILSKLNLKPNLAYGRHLFSVLSKLSLRNLSLNIIQNLTSINNSRLFFDILHFLSEGTHQISIAYLKSLLANPLSQQQQRYLRILQQQHQILVKQHDIEAYVSNSEIPKIRKEWILDRLLEKYHNQLLTLGTSNKNIRIVMEKCHSPCYQLNRRIQQINRLHGNTVRNDIITKIHPNIPPFVETSDNHITNCQNFVKQFVKIAMDTAIQDEIGLLRLLDYMFLYDNSIEQQPIIHQMFNFQRQKCVILGDVPTYSLSPSQIIRTRNILLIDFNHQQCYPTVFKATIGNLYLHIHYSIINVNLKQEQISIFLKGKNIPIRIKIQIIENLEHFSRNFVAKMALSELGSGPKLFKILGNDFIISRNNAIYLEEDIDSPADFSTLQQVVNKLHQHHIVVRNINPDGIARSKYDGRLVITDVRYVRGIENNVEQTEVCGNTKYMGREMAMLIEQRNLTGNIDLIANDIQAVQMVQKQQTQPTVEVTTQSTSTNHIMFLLSFLCSTQQSQNLFVFKTLQNFINKRKSSLFIKSINRNYMWQEQNQSIDIPTMYSFQECHLRYNFLEDKFLNDLTNSLNNIVILDFSHNCLTEVTVNILARIKLTYLTHLLLFDNMIGPAAWRIFNFDIPSIHTINIGQNQIGNAPDTVMTNNLKKLSISHNDTRYDQNFESFLRNLPSITYINIVKTLINRQQLSWKHITIDYVDSGEVTPKSK